MESNEQKNNRYIYCDNWNTQPATSNEQQSYVTSTDYYYENMTQAMFIVLNARQRSIGIMQQIYKVFNFTPRRLFGNIIIIST